MKGLGLGAQPLKNPNPNPNLDPSVNAQNAETGKRTIYAEMDPPLLSKSSAYPPSSLQVEGLC